MKTKILLFIISMGAVTLLHAQNPSPGFGWAAQIGNDSVVYAASVVLDNSGNQIITGYFKGSMDFDPGAGVQILTSNGLKDIFILKLNPDGSYAWAANMGDTTDRDSGFDLAVDASGNIYLTGYFWGTIDADPGPGYYPLSQNRYTAMVLKIAPDGNLIWGRQFGSGDMGHAYTYGITVDDNLNIITCGTFLGKVDFDPGSGTSYLTSSNMQYRDGFIHKLDQNGNFLWVKQLSGSENEMCYSLITDLVGNIYSTGYFTGTADFNPDKKLKLNLTSFGEYDCFAWKLDANGNLVWAKQFGGVESDGAYSVAMDGSNNLYFTGWFYGAADFNPGSGTFTMTPFGGDDAYLLKLTNAGDFVWAKQYGGPSYDAGHEVRLDAAGNIYVGGFFYSTADFDPGTGTYYLTAEGRDDSFIVKSDPGGNFLWVSQTGGPGWDYNLTLDVDPSGNIINVGAFEETVDFNPDGNGYFPLTNTGEHDLFFQKLTPSGGSNCPLPNGLNAAVLDETTAYLSWNTVPEATGYYVRYREIGTGPWVLVPGLIPNASFTLTGLVPLRSYEFQVKTDCESNFSYSFEFITAVPGCDDIYEPNNGLASAAPIAVNSDIIAMISTMTDMDWFAFSTTNSAKNVHITLTDLPADYNMVLYKSNGTFLAGSYNVGLADETINYNSSKTGSYAVVVYGSDSAYNPIQCYTMHVQTSSTGFKTAEANTPENGAVNGLSVYPNPASDILNVDISAVKASSARISLINTSGQTIVEKEFMAIEGLNHYAMDVSSIPNGLYMVKILNDNGISVEKVLINK